MKLESAGIPTVTVVSSEFCSLALAESQARGVRDLPLVEVPHPVGTISFDALRAVAESAVDAIVGKLLRGNDSISPGKSVSAHDAEGSAGAKSAYIPGRTGTKMQTVAVGDWGDGVLE